MKKELIEQKLEEALKPIIKERDEITVKIQNLNKKLGELRAEFESLKQKEAKLIETLGSDIGSGFVKNREKLKDTKEEIAVLDDLIAVITKESVPLAEKNLAEIQSKITQTFRNVVLGQIKPEVQAEYDRFMEQIGGLYDTWIDTVESFGKKINARLSDFAPTLLENFKLKCTNEAFKNMIDRLGI
jgi:chromosome segregation ATPase